MLLDLTPEQEFFRGTTAKFLADQVPAPVLQRFAGAVPEDFEARYWRRGAELGWTSLLVGEEAGGGSISGQPAVDLALIAWEFGRHAAPGPLLPATVVAAALSETGTHPEAVAELLAGTAVAAWCHAEPRSVPGTSGALPGTSGRSGISLEIKPDGAGWVLNGVKRPVEAAATARYLLVTGRDPGGGLTQVLVPAGSPGVAVTPLRTADYGRRLGAVTFTNVRVPATAVVGEPGGAGTPSGQVERQLQVALVVASAESAGAMQTGFEMTLAWARDRYSFGRPLASYQALKHRYADMKTCLEASQAITGAAAVAVGERAADAGELASAAKAYTGQYGPELMHECVQLHGGIGLTKEHDLHLYLRRVTTNAMLYGTPADHRARIADFVRQREGL